MRTFNKNKTLFYEFVIFLLFLSFVFSLLTYSYENGYNPNFFEEFIDCIFWWVASMTTVGAGPFPVTFGGKIFGMLTMLTGAILYLALLSEIIVWIKSKSEERFLGFKNYSGQDHILIIGYNDLAVGLINLLDSFVKPNVDIVLVTNLLDSNPNPDRVKFVKVHPITSSTLKAVNAKNAKVAFVLGAHAEHERAEINTVLTAAMIEELEKEVFTIAEVVAKTQVTHIKDFKIDDVFTYEELLADLKDKTKSEILNKLPQRVKNEILK